jgi:hypothetical protein
MKKIVRLTESDLVKIIKKVLNEQGVLGALSSRTGLNLSKSGPPKVSSVRAPRIMDDPTNMIDDCYYENIKKLVSYCKDNEYKFKPDEESKKITLKLHDNIDGISFGGAIDTLEEIKNEVQFCKVSNGYRYNGENLAIQIKDEVSLPTDNVWEVLKKFSAKFGIWDECNKRDHS